MADDPVTFGLDVGGTKTHAVAFNRRLEPQAEVRVATAADGPEALGELVVDTIAALRSSLGDRAVTALGVGIPGLVDRVTGSVRHAVNLGIGDQPLALADLVRAELGLPCQVDNDVNVAALGAFRLLRAGSDIALRGITDLAYLSIGTGIAAGVILDGRLHRGRRGVAGEIGHLPVNPGGPRCECGLRGCLEALASGAAIGRRWPSDGPASPTASLLAAAAGGDRSAEAARDELAHHWALAVYLLAITYDVDRVVIGGGVADLDRPLLNAMQSGLARLAADSAFVRSLDLDCRVILKPDGPVGAVGAAALVLDP